MQNDKVNIRAEVLMTKLPDKPDFNHELSLFPPKGGAKRIPALATPAQAQPFKLYSMMRFKEQLQWARDPALHKRNKEKRKLSSSKSRKSLDKNGVLEWACYLDLMHEKDGWTLPMLGFGIDLFENSPDLIGYRKPAWYPTMSLSVYFVFFSDVNQFQGN